MHPYILPLTCVVGIFMLYWLICILGVVGIETFDLDLDVDADGASEGAIPPSIAAALRFVNAADVPLMAVLSLLSIFMWALSILGSYYLNPGAKELLAFMIIGGAFVMSVIATKLVTTPLVPVFRKIKELEKAEPAVGGVGIVVSKQVDQKYGQVEQKRKEGAPAILNCRTSEDSPIPRGTEVAVTSYDKDRGIYLVRTL